MASEAGGASAPPPVPSGRQVLGVGALLTFGIATRFGLSCAAWTAFYQLKSRLSEKNKTPQQITADRKRGAEVAKAEAYMWGTSMLSEIGVSVLLNPSAYIIGKHVHRFCLEVMSPRAADALSIVDRFSIQNYLTFVWHYGNTNDSLDRFTFMWHLPATVLTLAKLLLRLKRKGREKTRLFSCLAALAVQYLSRTVMGTFALIPMGSDQEALLCFALMAVDKFTDAYLLRHTWPF